MDQQQFMDKLLDSEQIDDMDLYSNGGGRSVRFVIRPKQ